jgi:hypothetical protein
MFILFPKENVAKITIILFSTKFPMENYSLYFNFLLDCKMMGLCTDNASLFPSSFYALLVNTHRVDG